MDIVLIVVDFFVIYLPAMVANGAPVVISKFVKVHPIDMGKNWRDGRRILGDGKSFEGALGGVLAGEVTALMIGAMTDILPKVLLTGGLGSVGAILGDLTKSFFKRRLGYERGKSLPLADQLDFFLGATAAILLCPNCLHPPLGSFLLGLVLIPLLHVSTNILAYKLGLKSVPW